MNKKISVFVAAAAVGVSSVAVLAATLLAKSDDELPLQNAADPRQAALASEHSPTLGEPDAKVHIVEFIDPACETCAMFYPMVKEWMAGVPGEIRLSMRHIPFHSGADYAVRVLEASRNQGKYWETLEALLQSQQQWTRHHQVLRDKIEPAIAGVGLDMDKLRADMNSVEVMARMERDKKDAQLLKVTATPEYFVNGRPLPRFGARELANLVRQELQKNSQ